MSKFQGSAVDAVALPGGLRAVIEYMPQVTPAARAEELGARYEQLVVGVCIYTSLELIPEARPARAGLELGGGVEQRLSTGCAVIRAVFLGRPVATGKGTFRAGFSQYLVL